MPQLTALLSVSDKTGIVDFARALHAQGIRLLSTGGTAKLLSGSGLPVTEVSEITGFPEMLDGRVKTLHPRVHGGLLARRDVPAHMAALKEHGIGTIDLLIINLYPFAQATAKADCTLEDAIENIDIGGPAMLRAAAKNWQDVGVVIDPVDYPQVLAELTSGGLKRSTKFTLAKKVFAHTAAYDGMITNYLTALEPGSEDQTEAVPAKAEYPQVFNLQLHKVQGMRYGENPHQSAAFYREAQPAEGTLSKWQQIQGKELSFNNIADADAAWECVKAFDAAGLRDRQARQPLRRGHRRRPAGGLPESAEDRPDLGLRRHHGLQPPIDADVVEAINANKQFVEVAIAPAILPGARTAYAAKQNVRLLEVPIGRQASQRAGLQARGRRHAAAVGRQHRHRRRGQGRHQAATHRAADEGHAVRLDSGSLRQEQRHRLLQGRHDHGRGRRPDEPPGLGPHRQHQGPARRLSLQGTAVASRRLLPVPRRAGRGGRRRRDLRDPSGWLDARRRGDRRGRRARHCDGAHRHASLPSLTPGSRQAPHCEPRPSRPLSSCPTRPRASPHLRR
jgi:phosphoribosylaminoimidazolecarboxamide formyltransferase/IMP cyclohydrolase